MWLLNRLSANPVSFAQSFVMPAGPDISDAEVTSKTRELPKPFIACAGLILLSFFIIQSIDTRDEVIPDREPFVSFPLYFDGWQGQQDNLESIVTDVLQVTDYLLNDYERPDTPGVNLYVAYYKSQRKGVSPHSPRVCVPGGGWSITDLQRLTVDLSDNSGQVRVNRAIIQNGLNKQLVYYWFKQRGRDIASEYWMKWYLLTDSISMNRTDGSLVRLVTPILPNEKESDADQRLAGFLSTVNPMLSKYVPD
jgi:EpsI family protein